MQSDSSTHQQNFLSLLAEGIPPGSFFHVAQAVGDGFHNEVWRENLLEGPWYFFTGASTNRKHRRRSDLVAVRAIVIDDVGTKVDAAKLKAKPTWVLETSPGNYQWGYLLKTWDTDIPRADALFKALVEKGLQDTGVNTACRLFRIPGSVNLKKGRNNFEAVLTSFDFEVTYTVPSLAKALRVRPGKPIEPKLDTGERPGAGKPDRFLEWLQGKGLWTDIATGGWHLIQCPFANEHTDDRVDAKYLPTFASMDGKHKVECHHGHGEDKATYAQRFFDWAAGEGAPTSAGTDPGELRKMFAAIYTGPSTPQAAPPLPPGILYDHRTLIAAFGSIPFSALPDLRMTKAKIPAPLAVQPCTIENVEAGLEYLGVGVRLNLMTAGVSYTLPGRIERPRFGAKSQREIDEMVSWALKAVFNRVGIAHEQKLDACFAGLANANYWHPAKDWIESKPWDGQDRLQHLVGSVTTQSPTLFRTYFRRWALQTIEAACGWEIRRVQQKSLCLVLAGKQGIGKSRWLASLAPGYFVGGKHLSLDSYAARDSKHECLQGMVAELGELDTTFGKSAAGSLKAFISEPTDVYRLPYAVSQLTRPRCTSFAATVNDDKFLQDDTGSRRFAVAWVDHLDVDHATDMQQFWAQMHAEWAKGEPYWLLPGEEKLQAESNAQFQAVDAIDELIRMEIERREDRDIFDQECSLTATAVGLLIKARVEDKGMPRRLAAALRRVIGEWTNYRNRGGTAESWAFWLDRHEAKNMGVKVLRPKKA